MVREPSSFDNPLGASMAGHQKENSPVFLVYGATGWIGGKVVTLLEQLASEDELKFHIGVARLENREHVEREIRQHQPTHIINAAGVTGTPNVDWCETHKIETLRSNVLASLTVADLCQINSIHLTYFGSGCIYEYNEAHPEPTPESTSDRGYTEDDPPNFNGSFYSRTRAAVEQLLRSYDNCLVLRLRMPISETLEPKNFVTKLLKYEKIINVPNSVSILPDLLPISIYLARRRITGVFNFVNPGVISHNEVMDLYKKVVDPTITYRNFTVEEQDKVLLAKRSNCRLDTSKLQAHIPFKLDNVQTSLTRVFSNMKSEGMPPSDAA